MRTTLRNATLADLATLLTEQHARKVDVVAPASTIRAEGGALVISGTEAVLDESGVTTSDGRYVPTSVCDEGIADKLSIPLAYVRRMREDRPDLYDVNVNGWLHGFLTPEGVQPCENDPRYRAPDGRSFLVRCFRGDESGEGIARAFLSNGYKIMDNLDALTAALEGVRDAGVNVEIDGCDLSDRRMYLRIVAPEVTALAPLLLRNYRSPFENGNPAPHGARSAAYAAAGERFGYDGSMPVVFAGIVISNSETGGGAFTVTPRITVLRCWNGQTVTEDALRSVHLGAKMSDGVVRWSVDTQEQNLGLIAKQTRDAVSTFLDVDYVKAKLAAIEAKATAALNEPVKVVETVCKKLVYSEARTQSVLDLFIRGGDTTSGGVMHAVTAAAQMESDPDTAAQMEGDGLRALDFALAAS